MKQKLFIYLVLFFLAVSLAVAQLGRGAAGGGSGGGWGSGPPESSGGSSSSSSSSGEGPYFYGLECFDTGQLTFEQGPPIKPVVVEKEDGTNLTISGEWEGTTFTSEEAEINEAGIYTIHDSKNGDKTVECPGLEFSCRLVEVNIQECSYEGQKIGVTFTLTGKGSSTDDLQFQFQKYNSSRLLIYQKEAVFSSELKEVRLQEKGNNSYTLEVAGAPLVSKLKVIYPKCIGKYYVYSKIDCVEREERLEDKKEKLQKPLQINIKEEIKESSGEEGGSIFERIVLFIKKFISKKE